MAVSKTIVTGVKRLGMTAFTVTFVALSALILTQTSAQAQSYSFNTVQIEGNQRVEAGTILSYADIARGETVSSGRLNDAYQSLLGSGLFETVDLQPQGNTLVISVQEYPTINRISIEGNKRLKDEDLQNLLQSQSRRVYSPTTAERDAATLTDAYNVAGRIAATVEPKIIRRSDNRVDLVFEIAEGRVIEIERISFTGNRNYPDRRLRRILGTKQAGIFRQLIGSDTFVEDRIAFDRQVLSDFYQSRGYVDFDITNVNAELTRGRDAFLITFDVVEGQSFEYGELTAVSLLDDVDALAFQEIIKIKSGQTYSPAGIEQTIARMEREALQMGLNFVRVEPRVIRNDRDLTLDVEFELSRGPRVFVERIDIEGNNTTLDRVIRREFKIVEGDPFNPREIRQSAERIRALGYFGNAEVSASEGSSADSVVVDVDVEEVPTGQLGFGISYSVNDGVGLGLNFSERNFLGRGQEFAFTFNTASANRTYELSFYEPAFLGRDLRAGFDFGYRTTNNDFATFDSRKFTFAPSITFPVSENGRLSLSYTYRQEELLNVDDDTSLLIKNDADAGAQTTSSIGYLYSFDSRRTGLDPNTGYIFRFGQELAGLGGDIEYVKTTAYLGAETKVFNEELTLRAVVEAGALNTSGTDSRITDRFFGNGKIRGFEPNGIGPRDTSVDGDNALGGNYFAALRLEANFALPLPEEYGLSAGLYYDVGSVWGLDNTDGGSASSPFDVDESSSLRTAVGFSVFWETGLGPLRFNFSNPLQYEDYDNRQYFDLTISTRF